MGQEAPVLAVPGPSLPRGIGVPMSLTHVPSRSCHGRHLHTVPGGQRGGRAAVAGQHRERPQPGVSGAVGAVLGAGFRRSPWKGRGQMAGRSSSPLEEVTASLRHEAKHPLATSSRPQPGISWAEVTSPVPVVAAVSADLIFVSPAPL